MEVTTNQSANNPNGPSAGGTNTASGAVTNCDDLSTLDAEITELHRENARVESQMMRLKSDINAMETHITHGDRVRKCRLVEANAIIFH